MPYKASTGYLVALFDRLWRQWVAAPKAGTTCDQLEDDDQCRYCHGEQDQERLLLCDRCDAQYHTFCLQPPLERVPDDEVRSSINDIDKIDSCSFGASQCWIKT